MVMVLYSGWKRKKAGASLAAGLLRVDLLLLDEIDVSLSG
jgi:hypothetical protein